MRAFLSELRRRNVYKVGAAYVVVGWILTQVGSILFPTFGAPEWFLKVFTLLVLLGFPVALVFAWAFELTPEGLMLTQDVPREQSNTARTGRKLDFAIIGLLIVALGFSVRLNVEPGPGDREPSIAVLPFTSLGADPRHAAFVDGVHDELLSSLGNIGSLKVISRTSVMQYRDTPKPVRQIGEDLGVATVLEGTVRRAGDRIRMTVQLIDTATDEHLWTNTYDRQLSTDNIFTIQAEIATTIAEKLQATLKPDEKQRLEKTPTDNLEAYNLYLAGRQNLHERTLESLQRAREQFEQAIELDPSFAQTYAGLSDALMLLYSNYQAISPDDAFERAASLLEKALVLDSEDADIHASLGLLKSHVWLTSQQDADVEQAEDAFERAIALAPNHAEAMAWYGVFTTVRGDYSKANDLLGRSLDLDPLARMARLNFAASYVAIGENEKALEQVLATRRMHPEWPNASEAMAGYLLSWGRLDESLAWAHEAQRVGGHDSGVYDMVMAYLALGWIERAVDLLKQAPGDDPLWLLRQAFARRLEGDLTGSHAMLDAALARMEHIPPPLSTVAAETALLAGEFGAARGHFERLCPPFAAHTPRLKAEHCIHGASYAYVLQKLGERERARLVLDAMLPYLQARPRFGPDGHGIADVHTLALMGEHDRALARLRAAVDSGWRSSWSIYSGGHLRGWNLKDDPLLIALRDDARFQAIVSEVETDIARMRERALQAEASGDWEPLLALVEDNRTFTAETLQR